MIHFNSSKILIPVDFSETSLLAIKHGAFTAQLTKGHVYLLHVVNAQYMAQNLFVPLVNFVETNNLESKAEAKLAQLGREISSEFGVKVDIIIKTGNPSSEIVNIGKEIGASLIVMGTHGYSPIEELVIGSNALKVLTKSSCPTMAMSAEADHKGYNTILIPIDNSAHTRQKINYTLEMAQKFSATVHVLALLHTNDASEKADFEQKIHQIQVLAKEKNVSFHSEILTDVKNRAVSTVNYSQKIGADLLVIMTDQDAEISGFFLGPYSQQIIHLSKVPVIAIKPIESEAASFSILAGTSSI